MWDQRYSDDDYLFGTEPTAALPAQAHMLEPQSRCLCVADGEGRNSVWLAEQGHQVTAWDASPVAVEKACRLATERGVEVEFAVADAADYNWTARQYDAVIAIFAQFAAPDLRDQMFEGMNAALNPGGLIFLHGYTPKQLEYKTGGPPFAGNLYTPELLRSRFSDMDILRLEAYEADLAEGTGHAGRSAVIDLIASRKELA